MRHFLSGTNHPAEILGVVQAGRDVGACARDLRTGAEEALAASPGYVFLDSGAFGEVAFGPEGLRVVAPLTDTDWTTLLALYARLARALGRRLYLVAPDRVGCQSTTLERLERYREELRALHATGARLIVVAQRGALPQATFLERCAAVLGFSDFVVGVPCKKNATSPEELAALVSGFRCAAVHLLGIGPDAPRWPEYAACVRGLPATSDSVRILALVGRTNGRRGGPRPLTAAQDIARVELSWERWRETDGMAPLDYTDAIHAPEAWLDPTNRREIIASLRLLGHTVDVTTDLDAWLDTIDLDDYTAQTLDEAWARYHTRAQAGETKRRACARVFRSEPAQQPLLFPAA